MWLTSVSILLFAITLWLGLYLLARDFSKEHLRWAGLNYWILGCDASR